MMYLNWSICLIKVAWHQECTFGVLTTVNYCLWCRVSCCQASHKTPAAEISCLLTWLKWPANYLGKFEEYASTQQLALVAMRAHLLQFQEAPKQICNYYYPISKAGRHLFPNNKENAEVCQSERALGNHCNAIQAHARGAQHVNKHVWYSTTSNQ